MNVGSLAPMSVSNGCRFWQCSPEPVEGLRAVGIGTARLEIIPHPPPLTAGFLTESGSTPSDIHRRLRHSMPSITQRASSLSSTTTCERITPV